ncbi:MAG: hypothetical protein QW212_00610 [Nitrososphaerales archaeon]
MLSDEDIEMLFVAALGWADVLTWAAAHEKELAKVWGECLPYTALAVAELDDPDERVVAYTFKVFLAVAYLINKEGRDAEKEV